jgi:predicted metalloprotease
MRLDDLRESTNVEDRRGMGGGGRLAIGGGMGVVLLIVAVLFGVDPTALLGGGDPATAPAGQVKPSSPPPDTADFALSRKVVGSTEDVWTEVFAAQGRRYRPATFTVYEGGTDTGCGFGESTAGPFYCPADQKVYIDLVFFNELGSRFGAPGDFAKAYVVAHEIGHHVQNLMGTSREVQEAMQGAGGGRGAQGLSVRQELQADCYAGVWARRADDRFHFLEGGDIDEGLAAAFAVGDDTLQSQTRGRVVPDSFTHGSSAQRVRWFKRGLAQGDPGDCDTFGASRL